MENRKADMVWGVLWVLLSVFVWFYVEPYSKIPSFDPIGAEYFPRLLAVLIAVCGFGLFIDGFYKYRKERNSRDRNPTLRDQSIDDQSIDETSDQNAAENAQRRKGGTFRVILSVLACVAYGYLLEPVGYLILTPFFIAAIMLIYGERQKKTILYMSIGFTLALYAVFALGLKVLLPHGILFFLD